MTCHSWLLTISMSISLDMSHSQHFYLDMWLLTSHSHHDTLQMPLLTCHSLDMSLLKCHSRHVMSKCHSWHVTLGVSLLAGHFRPFTFNQSLSSFPTWHITLYLSLSTSHSWNITLDLGLLTCHSWHMYIIFLEILKDFEIWKFFVRHSLTDSHLRDLEELSLLKMLQHGL